jgi:Prealbumin-like fold domain
MYTFIVLKSIRSRWALSGVVLSVLVAGFYTTTPASAQNQATGTVTFELEKKFSGPYPAGYAADQFTFSVSGYAAPVSLTAFTDDSAFGTIALPVGTYQLTETGPTDFVSGEWTVQWSGAGCTNQTANSTTITVNERDIGSANFGCRADNQWRHGNLLVTKEVVGTSTAPENFSFRVMQGDSVRFSGAFEPDGQTEVLVAAGLYTVSENVYPHFTTTYSADCAGTMMPGGSRSCTITNTYTGSGNGTTSTGRIVIQKQTVPLSTSSSFTFDPSWSETPIMLAGGEQSTSSELVPGVYSLQELPQVGWIQTNAVCSDGSPLTAIVLDAGETTTCVVTNTQTSDGGGGDDERFRVFGYVWHDRNENTVWEVAQPNPADDERDLDGWEVRISNGSTTLATTTDTLGYYYFEVPVGTWKITEVVQSLWKVTFPVTNEHTVMVVANVARTNRSADTVWEKIINYILPPVYAQGARTYGPFNFGNVQSGSSDGDGGGGSSSGGRSNRSRSSTVSAEPQGLILGAATSTLPVGAPNTGAGGASVPTYPGRALPFMAIPERRYQQIVWCRADRE